MKWLSGLEKGERSSIIQPGICFSLPREKFNYHLLSEA
jgi:hypothetical protein